MKKIFLLLVFCFSNLGFLFGQTLANSFKIPAKIESAFHKEFSGAKIYSVQNILKNKKHYYKIETIVSKKINGITYNESGKIVVVEKEIALNKIPEKLLKKLKKKYPGSEIVIARKIIKNKKVSYELSTTQSGEEYIINISDKSKILNRKHIFEKVEEGC